VRHPLRIGVLPQGQGDSDEPAPDATINGLQAIAGAGMPEEVEKQARLTQYG